MNHSQYHNVLDFEYLTFSKEKLGIEGIFEILDNLSNDIVIKHVNFNYNISAEEVSKPQQMQSLLSGLKQRLMNNKSLTALDLAGNHLFDYSQHPTNEHLTNYVIDFTEMLLQTNITHVDLSQNSIVGFAPYRQLKGLVTLMRKYFIGKGKALACRSSGLNSQAIRTIADGLGSYSTMTYLDINDNYAGLDPSGNHNSEGIETLSILLSQNLHSLSILHIWLCVYYS